MTRILCLWLPNWPIQRLIQSRPELSGRPVVLEAADTRRGGASRGSRVAACCSAAVAMGIRLDMPLAEAKSLIPALAIERHQPRKDFQALCALAEACARFSPCVALEEGDEPESLLMDITNLAHLLGTDAELAAQVEKFFTHRRYRVEIAVADTVGLAWAVAHYVSVFQPPLHSPVIMEERDGGLRIEKEESAIRNPKSEIMQLPVEALRIAEDTAALLRQLGIETIGQLLPLPRDSLAPRFGEQLLRRLDQLLGASPEVLVPHREPAALEMGCSLEQPTADRAMLAHVLAQLTQQLAGRLATRDQGAVLLVCVLTCADRQSTSLRVGLMEPSANPRQFLELIDLHLETLVLAAEVVHVEIRAAVVGRLGERQGELFPDRWPSDPHQLAVLVNRLSSRLGYEQVVRPQLRPSPLPERAVRYVPVTEREARSEERGKKRFADSRPLLLYPEPQPLEVICVVPDGPPQFVWLNHRRQRITHHAGPERIETLWWRGPSVRRDYYRIATESGSHLWLFRSLADGRWFLHGIFA